MLAEALAEGYSGMAAGLGADAITSTLLDLSRYEVPQAVLGDVRDLCARYGRVRLLAGESGLLRVTAEPALLTELARAPTVAPLLCARPSPGEATIAPAARGPLKHALVELGWPVEDLAPYEDGTPLNARLRPEVQLRDYQADAAAAFERTGAGVIVLQVTLVSYQMLTHRSGRDEPFAHLDLFAQREWGLVVYDEVHLLPAPVFRATARIQARRRLGLTATLVREDGAEPLVFSLIGAKRYNAAWRELEADGWIARAECMEVRVPMAAEERMRYALADRRARFRTASTNPAKAPLVRAILDRHPGAQALVIGHYLDQLERLARELGAPLTCGRTPRREREAHYNAFRAATSEQDYARKRQRFLAAQGYGYAITTAADLTDRPPFSGSLRPVRDAA